jgi:hypothetical protein
MSLLSKLQPTEFDSLLRLVKSTMTLVASPTEGFETFEIQRSPQGNGGSGGHYQVPAGYTLHITEMLIDTTSESPFIVIGYGDDAVEDGGVAPQNAVGLIPPMRVATNGAGTAFPEFIPLMVKVPEGKYPYAWQILGESDPVPVILHGILLPA